MTKGHDLEKGDKKNTKWCVSDMVSLLTSNRVNCRVTEPITQHARIATNAKNPKTK